MTIFNDPLLVLHKYFMAANLMRIHFEIELEKNEGKSALDVSPDLINTMCLWYGCLHVVVEGWNTLNFNDPIIDQLLKSEHKDLLRGCRNDTFHFQDTYYPKRFINLISDKESARWVRDLNQNFGRFFIQQFEDRKK